MAELRPFRGVRYNESVVGDLAAVICPPYDIISPSDAQALYHKSEYNFVRLDYGRILPPGADVEEKHTNAAAILDEWFTKGVLRRDEKPAIYLHHHTFAFQDNSYCRRSLTAAVRLADWNQGIILPHEATRKRDRSDRLNLLWAISANTSPILTLFEDGGEIAPLLAAAAGEPPLASLVGDDESRHEMWAINDPEVINRIAAALAGRPLYIADGHHRYESALNYQRERQICAGTTTGDEDFNFVMMNLVDFADPGLIVFSPHRLLRGISRAALNDFYPKLAALFEIEVLPLEVPDFWQQLDFQLATDNTNEVRFIMLGLDAKRFHVLRLRDSTAADQMMPRFHGELYSKLAVSILDDVIIGKMLGLTSDSEEGVLAFDHDKRDTVEKVLGHEYQLGFLLGPIDAGLVKKMADGGERMPRKSTYFHPKPPSGLVFRRID